MSPSEHGAPLPPAGLAHLAARYSCSSPGTRPQHPELAQRFRRLNVQEFQALAQLLYTQWKKVENAEAARQEMARTFAVANFRRLFAEQVLAEGGRLLQAAPAASPEAVVADIVGALHRMLRLRACTLARLPASFAQDLEGAVGRGVELVREAAQATPPGELFFPQRGLASAGAGAAFDPAVHEPLPGCPAEGALRIRLTAFPGYRVGPDGLILEKALVYTCAEA